MSNQPKQGAWEPGTQCGAEHISRTGCASEGGGLLTVAQTLSSALFLNWLNDLASHLLPWVSRRIRTSPHWRVGNLPNSHSPEGRRLGLLERRLEASSEVCPVAAFPATMRILLLQDPSNVPGGEEPPRLPGAAQREVDGECLRCRRAPLLHHPSPARPPP